LPDASSDQEGDTQYRKAAHSLRERKFHDLLETVEDALQKGTNFKAQVGDFPFS